MNGTLLSEAYPNLLHWITVVVKNDAAPLWTILLPSGVALFIAVGGNLIQFVVNSRQNKRREHEIESESERQKRRDAEGLLRQKTEEYFLKSEILFMAFAKWSRKLHDSDAKVRDEDVEALSIQASLTMLETLYFPSLRGKPRAIGEVASRLRKGFERLTKSTEALTSWGAQTTESQNAEWLRDYDALKAEFQNAIDETKKLLEGLNPAKLAEEYVAALGSGV